VRALTVLGWVEARDLGKTLIHEHLLFDFSAFLPLQQDAAQAELVQRPVAIELLGALRFDAFSLADNVKHGDIELTIEELGDFTSLGGRTVVDPTNSSLGRDPLALQQIARATGLNIVMGSGYYTEFALGEDFKRRSIESLTEELVRDVTEGVDDTSVRAGLIGEIGTSSPITPNEFVSLRAAARAQAATGAPLMIHLDGWGREGHRVLDIVAEEGGALHQTILCHMNPSCNDFDYQQSLAARGAYIEYDMMGMTAFYPPNKVCPDDLSALQGIAALIEAGYGERVLMSQDVFLKMMFRRYGGLGYTHVFENLPPLYREVGINDTDLTTIFVENPCRVVAFEGV
jgi:phosphotriesterase-related protein